MSSAERMAETRKRRKEQGLSQATVWLTKDDDEALRQFMAARRIESKQEAFSAALRSGLEKEMHLAG